MAWKADQTIIMSSAGAKLEVFEVKDEHDGKTICFIPVENKDELSSIVFIGKYLELVKVMSQKPKKR